MDKMLWELFKKTGDYRYYMMLRELENVKEDGNQEGKRDNN